MGGVGLTATRAHALAAQPFLLDTHIWLWYLTGSYRLPTSLRDAIDANVGDIWLSPISIWETGMLHARGRITLEGGPRQWAERARRAFAVEEAALNGEVALRSHEFDLGHRDPADHLIAATALVYGLTLMTVDARLQAADWLPTRSS